MEGEGGPKIFYQEITLTSGSGLNIFKTGSSSDSTEYFRWRLDRFLGWIQDWSPGLDSRRDDDAIFSILVLLVSNLEINVGFIYLYKLSVTYPAIYFFLK